MAKLRKMLGKIEEPEVVALMRLIETQSKETLAAWAADYTESQVLSIYEKAYAGDDRLRDMLWAVRSYLNGEKKLTELKVILRDGRKIAGEIEDNPAAQAAARAISTACAVVQTPTNALGFTFYTAAAVVYDRAGLEEKPDVYDAMASEELRNMRESLEAAAVPDEKHPAKISWGC